MLPPALACMVAMRFRTLVLLLAASAFLTPPAAALTSGQVNVVTIRLQGNNADFHPDFAVSSLFPVPGGLTCGPSTVGPGSFEVSCTPEGYSSCLAWQVFVATTGGGGIVTGTAVCDGGIPSTAGVPKPGSAVGPLVVGPAPFPLRCAATWATGAVGGYAVTCVFVIT